MMKRETGAALIAVLAYLLVAGNARADVAGPAETIPPKPLEPICDKNPKACGGDVELPPRPPADPPPTDSSAIRGNSVRDGAIRDHAIRVN